MNRLFLWLACAAALAWPEVTFGAQVNIYSHRQPELIAPLLEAFTRKTGIETRVLNLDRGLLERLKAEGGNSPADVILTVDIGRLIALKDAGVTQSVEDAIIEHNIPVQYRDSEGQWFGLTMRARVIYASRDRIKKDHLDYEDLVDEQWRGRICTRSGQHAYNLALFASIIAHDGASAAKSWLEGLKANLARSPAGNDRAQAQAIFAGECDLALGNTYYVGLMQTNDKHPEQKEWANAIKVIFPNALNRGTHVNLSGMAMAANAPNRANALALMEFLSSREAQETYGARVFEYPLMQGAKVSPMVAAFGNLKPDSLPLEEIAALRNDASRLVDEVGFDN